MKRLLTIAAVLVTLLCPASARADSLTFQNTGLGVWNVTIGGSALGSGGPVTGFAGQIDWSWLNGPPPGFENNVVTYCVDVLHDVISPETVEVWSTNDMPGVSPNVSNAGQLAAWLYNTYAGSITTNAQAAGLQIALWEALYDGTPDANVVQAALTTGTIFFSGLSADVIGAATGYLTGLTTATLGTSAIWLDSSDGQGQITNVPEPASLSLIALGLCTAYRTRRKLLGSKLNVA